MKNTEDILSNAVTSYLLSKSIAWFRRDKVFFMLCMDTDFVRITVVRKTTHITSDRPIDTRTVLRGLTGNQFFNVLYFVPKRRRHQGHTLLTL